MNPEGEGFLLNSPPGLHLSLQAANKNPYVRVESTYGFIVYLAIYAVCI